MTKTPENMPDSVPQTSQPKKIWHAPTLEETSYTATEAGGGPGVNYDGIGFYSVP